MADWIGTVVSLWDTAVRVATFANDLRAAQDDFIALRAEAECLLICINSLNSPSCLATLYRYINAQQAADLKAIVKNTELNMVELNQFLAKCKVMVQLAAGRKAMQTGRRRRRVSKRVKEVMAKAWATYRFTMKDKQAFRDRLILPAQSINIYLTMLTHVGLVNVKFLMELSGDGEGVGVGAGVGAGAGVGGVGGGNNQDDDTGSRNGGGGGGGGGVIVNVGPVDRWSAVGRRVAFRDSIADESELTTDIEAEIVRYALHLTRGGTPFQRSSGRPRITKGPKRRTRSRPRSAGAFGVERDRKGQMYLVRERSVGNLSAGRIEGYWSGSESEGHASRRRFLALPAPPD